MSEKSRKFGDKKVNKSNFYKNKKPFKAEDIGISKILVSKNTPYDKESVRYLIGYNDDDVTRQLCKLPQMVGYVTHFKNNDSKDTITMSFYATNNRLLKKYIEIWEKVSSLLDKEFDSETVYGNDDKYIKTKIKQYKDKINTNFQGRKMPKENESYERLSLMLESVVKGKNKKYCLQTLLEECKYEIKKKKVENIINDDFDQGSSDNEEYNDNEESND